MLRTLIVCSTAILFWFGADGATAQRRRVAPEPAPKILRSIPSETKSDALVDSAVRATMGFLEPEFYFFNRVDLNNDGEPEIIVYPLGQCGSGGCGYWILEKKGGQYVLVSHIVGYWTTVVVGQARTNGWSDLIMWYQNFKVNPTVGYYVLLKFDGTTYPESAWTGQRLGEVLEGVRYLAQPPHEEFAVPLESR